MSDFVPTIDDIETARRVLRFAYENYDAIDSVADLELQPEEQFECVGYDLDAIEAYVRRGVADAEKVEAAAKAFYEDRFSPQKWAAAPLWVKDEFRGHARAALAAIN